MPPGRLVQGELEHLYSAYVSSRSEVFEKIGAEEDGVTVSLFTYDGVVRALVNAAA